MTAWWENSDETPRFSTKIPTRESAGNTMNILATATQLMKQLGIDQKERDALAVRVMSAGSRKEALDAIRMWFPLQDDEDE